LNPHNARLAGKKQLVPKATRIYGGRMSVRRSVTLAVGSVLAAALAAGAIAATRPPDRLPPTKPTIDGQLAPTVLRPVFTFGATDRRTPRGKMRFRCAFDGGALRACARIHRPVAALSFGRHTLRVRALDLAGNLSRVATLSFTVVGSWDAARDFERAPRPANPGRDRYGNSTWFYLFSGTPAHDPANYHLFPTFAVLAPNWEMWHNSSGNPTENPGSSTGFVNNRISMHPGHYNLGQNAVLGWRSPVASDVLLTARLENVDSMCPVPDNGILWSIDNGTTSIRSGFLGPSAFTQMELTTSVSVGDSIYVVVNDAGDSNCDTALVDLTVETR
jgi:hypothetical protein